MSISREGEWQAFLVHLLTKIIEQFKEAERFFQLAETYGRPTLNTLRLLENCFRISERIHGMIKAADSVHYAHLEKEGAVKEFQGMSRKTGKLQDKAQELYVKVWGEVKKAEEAIWERFYWK